MPHNVPWLLFSLYNVILTPFMLCFHTTNSSVIKLKTKPFSNSSYIITTDINFRIYIGIQIIEPRSSSQRLVPDFRCFSWCHCFLNNLHDFLHALQWLVVFLLFEVSFLNLNELLWQVLEKPWQLFYLLDGDPLQARNEQD